MSDCPASRVPTWLLGTTALLFAVLQAWSHPGIDVQIRELTERIAKAPQDATLFLRRAELQRIHRDWVEANADYTQAGKLDPGLAAVDRCLGRMKLEAGRPSEALPPLDRYLARRPGDAEGLALRGRARLRTGRPLEAAEDFTRALAVADGRPEPEHYVERARALEAAGPEHLELALRGLDEGLERLGQLVTLQLLAVELEVRRGNHDAALSRLERIASVSTRQESWLLRRGEILERAGKPTEALEAYRRALGAIAGLPLSRRHTQAVNEIENEARKALARLQGDGPRRSGPQDIAPAQ